MQYWRLLLLGTLSLLATLAARDLTAAPKIESVRIGLDGKFKLGHWTPVQITLVGDKQPQRVRLEISAPDGDGIPSRYVDAPAAAFDLPAADRLVVMRYIRIGRSAGELAFLLHDADGNELARYSASDRLSRALSATVEWTLSIGGEAGVDTAVRLLDKQAGDEKGVLSRMQQAADLPDRWWGYEGVDTLVAATRTENILEQLTPQQYQALLTWVRMGGRLVVSVGERGEQMFAGSGRFADLAPGTFAGVQTLEETKGLETLTAASQPLSALTMTLFRDVPPRYVEAFEGDGPDDMPTIFRWPLGCGHVVLIAVDLDGPPCEKWPGRGRLVAKLIRGPESMGEENAGRRTTSVIQIGYDDISGQLRGALDHFEGITLVPFSWISGLIVLYILLIGPVDYLVLRKLFRRMHWTWVTFPATVLLFCVLAWMLAGIWKGRSLRINQVDLVDIDFSSLKTDEGGKEARVFLRGTTWANLYSPNNAAYDLDLRIDDSRETGVLLSWQGLPGKSLGGMQSRTRAAAERYASYQIAAEPFRADDSPGLNALPIQASATKTISARWWSWDVLPMPGTLSAADYGLGGQEELRGAVTNPLDAPLSDCVLFYGSGAWVFSGGTLKPGESFRIQSDARMRSRAWRLNRHRVVEAHDVSTPWDTSSVDVPRIVEMMMFHQAARGRSYTQLRHRYQGYLDMSEHLRLGRAILVGRTPTTAARLRQAGKNLEENYDQRWTFYRLVLPVKRTKGQ